MTNDTIKVKFDERDDELGDWRIDLVGRIAQDLPATVNGAPAHKEGTPFFGSSSVKMENGAILGFTLPSAPALALEIAATSSKEAKQLLLGFAWRDVLTPDGPGYSISNEDTKSLFDFFQKCMITATFAYQALETFSNYSIERKLKEPVTLKRRNKKVTLSPTEIERQLSTSEKLCQILPDIYDVSTPKGKQPWEQFKKLKNARDSSIHLKTRDQTGKDSDTLYYEFLSGHFETFPLAAANMISWFVKGQEQRWLKHWYRKYA